MTPRFSAGLKSSDFLGHLPNPSSEKTKINLHIALNTEHYNCFFHNESTIKHYKKKQFYVCALNLSKKTKTSEKSEKSTSTKYC